MKDVVEVDKMFNFLSTGKKGNRERARLDVPNETEQDREVANALNKMEQIDPLFEDSLGRRKRLKAAGHLK